MRRIPRKGLVEAEMAANVGSVSVASGGRRYDNKGNVVDAGLAADITGDDMSQGIVPWHEQPCVHLSPPAAAGW